MIRFDVDAIDYDPLQADYGFSRVLVSVEYTLSAAINVAYKCLDNHPRINLVEDGHLRMWWDVTSYEVKKTIMPIHGGDRYYVKYTWYRRERNSNKPAEWHDECKGFKTLADALWCTTDTLAMLHSPLNWNVTLTSIRIENRCGDTIHFWTIG